MIRYIPFETKYQEKLIKLILDIQQIEFNISITKEQQPDLQAIDTFYRKNGGEFWLAIDSNDDVVGSIALINIGNGNGVIRKMFVKQAYRGKDYGIAQKLFEMLLCYCKMNAFNYLYLGTVNILAAAITFYKRNQWIEIQKSDLPLEFPLMIQDNIFFSLDLTRQNKQ
jgi:putative acetyltransferase|tara:strand:- start:116 stop:619 length:504 start_codon:yes stop_codon:yes gene_type:complete